jgi:hypothetical protein
MFRQVPGDVIAQPVSPHMLPTQPEAAAEYTAARRPQIGPFWHCRTEMNAKKPDDEQYTDEEAERRAAAALRRSLTTPHKPQEMIGKVGRAQRKRSAKSAPKAR